MNSLALVGLLLTSLLGASTLSAQNAPVIFFTDLTSGPNNHGEHVGGFAGAYVTLYGNYFGLSQSSSKVTLNGANCLRVASWSTSWQWYQKIVVQLGPNCSSGDFVVTVGGIASNPAPFAVRDGNIYFVSQVGKDTNNGSYSSPWKTIPHAVRTAGAAAGSVIYLRDGVFQAEDDGQGWRTSMLFRPEWCKGTDLQPNALVAYPGARAGLGTVTGPGFGLRAEDHCEGRWTIAGLQIRGSAAALSIFGLSNSPARTWRIVGNDISCPNGDGAGACLGVSKSSDLKVYGNSIHDAGKIGPPSASALYHGVYFSTDTNHVDFGWNTIANVHGCRGLQLHSTGGYDLYDFSIHDNVIHDTQCDGIVLATTNPSRGQISVFNNVIYNTGQGPNNPEHTGMWTCVYLAAYTNRGPMGGGTVEMYNNTMYNCGGFQTPPYGEANGGILNGGGKDPVKIHIQNNIIYQLNPSAPYFINDNALPDGIYGSNNVMYGIGKPQVSSYVANTMTDDPQLVSPGADFHLRIVSRCRSAGTAPARGTTTDHDGVVRSSSPTIGAYQ